MNLNDTDENKYTYVTLGCIAENPEKEMILKINKNLPFCAGYFVGLNNHNQSSLYSQGAAFSRFRILKCRTSEWEKVILYLRIHQNDYLKKIVDKRLINSYQWETAENPLTHRLMDTNIQSVRQEFAAIQKNKQLKKQQIL